MKSRKTSFNRNFPDGLRNDTNDINFLDRLEARDEVRMWYIWRQRRLGIGQNQ